MTNTRKQVVLGPPGTGKTTWTSKQIGRAREKYGNRILVCSFTRAAASELLGRNLELPEDRVGTLHAICFRALGRPQLADKHIKEFIAETGIVVGSSNPDASVGFVPDDPLRALDTAKSKGLPEDMWPMKLRAFNKEWTRWKDHHGLMDFTDLIETAYHDLEKAPGDPQAIFYDEAQDGSVLDLNLIEKWAAHAEHTIVVGDEDQTLYRFRGADPEHFLRFGNVEPIVLSQSYRLPRFVHEFALDWIETNVTNRAPKDYKPRDEDGELVMDYNLSTSKPWNILRSVEKDLDQGLSVMILARTNKQITAVVRALKDASMPYHNPYSARAGQWNPLRRSSKRVTATQRVLSWASIPWTWESAWHFTKTVEAASIAAKKKEVEYMAKTTPDEIVPVEEIERIFGPDWLDAIDDEDHDHLMRCTLASKRGPLEYPLNILKNRGLEALQEEPKIVVGTIHSVKGGQADSVYLFPDLSWFDGEALAGLNGLNQREDIYRIFYVGMTRARYKLTLCGPPTKGDSMPWSGRYC